MVLLSITLLSLGLCIWLQPLRPTATFYLSPFRAWELALGSMLALDALPRLGSRTVKEGLAIAAAGVLLGSVLLIQADASFPGWRVLFPVLATGLLIYCGNDDETLVGRLLGSRPFVALGLISYSVYLWHWPLVTFWRYRHGMQEVSPLASAGLLTLTLLVGALSYFWVERPFRRRRSTGSKGLRSPFLVAGAAMILIGGLSIFVTLNEGWSSRAPTVAIAYDKARTPFIPFSKCDARPLDGGADVVCSAGRADSEHVVLLWGDSHALAWAPGLAKIAQQQDFHLLLAVDSNCAPLVGAENKFDPECRPANDGRMAWIRQHHPDTVIMVAKWPAYSVPGGYYTLSDEMGVGNAGVFPRALRRTLGQLSPNAGTVLLIGPTPGTVDNLPLRMALATIHGDPKPEPRNRADFSQQAGWYWSAAKKAAAGYDNVTVLDPSDWFCDQHTCRYVGEDGELLYRDGNHLSVEGARFVAARVSPNLSFAR